MPSTSECSRVRATEPSSPSTPTATSMSAPAIPPDSARNSRLPLSRSKLVLTLSTRSWQAIASQPDPEAHTASQVPHSCACCARVGFTSDTTKPQVNPPSKPALQQPKLLRPTQLLHVQLRIELPPGARAAH